MDRRRAAGRWSTSPAAPPVEEDLDARRPRPPGVPLQPRRARGLGQLARAGAGRHRRRHPDPPDGRIERDPPTGEPTGALHEGAAYTLRATAVPAAAGADGRPRSWRPRSTCTRSASPAGRTPGSTPADPGGLPRAGRRRPADRAAWSARCGGTGTAGWTRSPSLPSSASVRRRRRSRGSTPRRSRSWPTASWRTTPARCSSRTATAAAGTTDNHGLTYVDARAARRRGHRARPPGLPGAPARHRRPRRPQRARRRRGGARRERAARPPAPHRAPAGRPARGLPRFAALGVVAELPGVLGAERAADGRADHPVPRRANGPRCSTRSATCCGPGRALAMGSDWAVTTADPLQQIEVAVTRVDPANRDSRAVPARAGAAAAEVALAAFTAGSAYVNHDADGGTLRVGAAPTSPCSTATSRPAPARSADARRRSSPSPRAGSCSNCDGQRACPRPAGPVVGSDAGQLSGSIATPSRSSSRPRR